MTILETEIHKAEGATGAMGELGIEDEERALALSEDGKSKLVDEFNEIAGDIDKEPVDSVEEVATSTDDSLFDELLLNVPDTDDEILRGALEERDTEYCMYTERSMGTTFYYILQIL